MFAKLYNFHHSIIQTMEIYQNASRKQKVVEVGMKMFKQFDTFMKQTKFESDYQKNSSMIYK